MATIHFGDRIQELSLNQERVLNAFDLICPADTHPESVGDVYVISGGHSWAEVDAVLDGIEPLTKYTVTVTKKAESGGNSVPSPFIAFTTTNPDFATRAGDAFFETYPDMLVCKTTSDGDPPEYWVPGVPSTLRA